MKKIKKPLHRCVPCDASVYVPTRCLNCWWFWVEEIDDEQGERIRLNEALERKTNRCQPWMKFEP